jgi:Na+/H+ antiporter NhaA
LLAVDREPRVSAIPFGPAARGAVFVPTRPLRLFVATEARSAIPLLGATTAALVWANSPWLASYEALWSTSVVPALLYLGFNAGGPAARGWAMAMAGDLAFALGGAGPGRATVPPRSCACFC